MRPWFLLPLLLVCACQPLALISGDTAVERQYAGAYGGDLVWQGRVTMTGDVLILAAGSLTIKPGTEVHVVPAEGTQIDPEYFSSLTELLVRGKLNILGTAGQPVRFVVVDRPEVEDPAWAGITLDGAGASTIRHAVIERAETGIRCNASSPEISDSRVGRCRYGVIVQQQSHPKLIDNRIEDGEGGVFVWRGSRPYLKGNVISGNDEEGVFVDADSRPWLDRNTIAGNAIGLALTPRDLPYDETGVTGNLENLRWLGPGTP